MERETETHSEKETRELASTFAKQLKAGDVVCLRGELGAGKTQFVKGIATRFGIDPDDVQSPTFTLINEYYGTLPVYHFDWYRIESEKEAREVGTEEYFYGEGVSVIEWPEKIESLIPDDAYWIKIESQGPHSRKFVFDNKTKLSDI